MSATGRSIPGGWRRPRPIASIDAAHGAQRATIDLGGIEHLDTAGAWLIDRSRAQLAAAGIEADYARAQPEYKILLEEAHYRVFEAPPPSASRRRSSALLSDIGESVYTAGRDLIDGVGFLGRVVTTTVVAGCSVPRAGA